jgi:hypothetical protein
MTKLLSASLDMAPLKLIHRNECVKINVSGKELSIIILRKLFVSAILLYEGHAVC